MRGIIYILLLLIAARVSAEEYIPQDPEERRRIGERFQLEERQRKLERWRTLATQPIPDGDLNDYISELGRALRANSKSRDKPDIKGDKLYTLVQKRLLSTPGHAEYYRDRINQSRTRMEEAREANSLTLGKAFNDMIWEKMNGFETLENLPSPENVRVLGEFLSDERGKATPGEEARETPNNRLAATSLSRLGIANPPAPPARVSEDLDRDLDTWKNWYAEVKAGRRTFRFIGDPVDYDLRGPSKRGEVLPNTSRSGKRADTSGETGASQSPERQTSRFLPYLLGFLFVAAGLACYFKRRKANA